MTKKRLPSDSGVKVGAKQELISRWKRSANRQWMLIGQTLGQDQLDQAFLLGLNEGLLLKRRDHETKA